MSGLKIDIKDMSNLTLSELIPDESMDKKRLDLILRALESKLLNIPARLEMANKNIDFTCGSNEAIMVDVTDISTELYELVASVREFLPIKQDA